MLKISWYNEPTNIEGKKIKILYNLSGPLVVNQEKLGLYDILLINSSEMLEIERSEGGSCFYTIFYIEERELSQLFQHQKLYFSCNSSREKNDNILLLRKCLTKLLLAEADTTVLSKAEFQEYSYELYLILMKYFRISKLSLTELSFKEKLIAYISEHSQSDLTLSKMSSSFYMTPQYFSKIFKETMGLTFYKYLTKVRLSSALNLLDDPEYSILHVAMESGFPNIGAFNKAFKDYYKELPSDYRKRLQIQEEASKEKLAPDFQEISKILKGQLLSEEQDNWHHLSIDVTKRNDFSPYWHKVINLGNVQSLNQKRVEEQFLVFQKSGHFEFVRFVLKFPTHFDDNYTFYQEELYMDFLITLNLKCQIVIDFREYDNQENFLSYFKDFLSRCSNRYSIDRIRQWRFELDYMTVFDKEKCQRYFNVYQLIEKVLNDFEIEGGIFGPGFILGDMSSLQLFISQVETKAIDIGHLTFHVLPNIANTDKHNNLILQQVTDINHIQNQLEIVQSYLADYYNIHIVEWKDYTEINSWINDSSFRAASMVKNTLACFDRLEDIAWAPPLDLLVEEQSGAIINGSDGCITRHGIKKPSFYAHYFLGHHGDKILAHDKYSMVCCSGENITIVSHNCATLNYRYYMDEFFNPDYQYEDYFEETSNLQLRFALHGLKAGTYLIKTRVINNQTGSVQNLMSHLFLEQMTEFGESEIDYLRMQSIPKIILTKEKVVDGLFTLDNNLEPNEIRHTHIIYLY